MCAGITTYNALRNSGARVGDVVAILGIGGLGHLGIQFAAKVGFKTVAIARGKDKEELVRKRGASYYIDSKSQNPVEELVKLGGALGHRNERCSWSTHSTNAIGYGQAKRQSRSGIGNDRRNKCRRY
ncbi:MAG: zinc-binding dehydrogenase [Candidatus Nitrosopolaris sp.]